MPMVGLLKNDNGYYLFADNNQYVGNGVVQKRAPRQYNIQKFKNFVVAYSGSPSHFMKLVDTFDFDSFPEQLTKSWLLRNFYLDFLKFLVEVTRAEVNNGILTESDFNLMIVGKDFAFDIGDEYLYDVKEFNANGDDKIAFLLYENLRGKLKGLDMVKAMMKRTAQFSYKVKYPFILVDSNDLNTLYEYNEDGTVVTEKLIEHWRKE